jgi:hypothetical protein
VYRFVNETPQRVGMGDWYDTANGNHLFMHSRPVVGGVFLQLLYDRAVWKKWAARDKTKAANWAPMPTIPERETAAPAANRKLRRLQRSGSQAAGQCYSRPPLPRHYPR